MTTRTPTPAPPELPPSTEVEFRATDGEPVKAVFTPAGKDAPAVVLMHEIRGRTEQWDELVPYLHDAGFATLAYESRGTPVEADRVLDTIGAVRWLRTQRDVDPKRLALVGASVGASTAVLAMATKARKTVDAAVALSPPDTQDIWTLQEEGRYRAHDILFIADEREATVADEMVKGASRSTVQRSDELGHGVRLLPEPGVREALLAWLGEHVR